MLFAGLEAHMVKNCDRGLDVTVFHHTDPPYAFQIACLFFPAVNWFRSQLQKGLFTQLCQSGGAPSTNDL